MFPNPPLEHSLPVASVLTGSDRHSLLETLFILIAPFFLYILNPQITTGSERSKGSTSTEFPIHYR